MLKDPGKYSRDLVGRASSTVAFQGGSVAKQGTETADEQAP